MIGDTVRFVNVANAEIKITGRIKHFLSLCGEHLSVENMTAGVSNVAHELNLNIPEFTVFGLPYESLFQHQWFIACDQEFDENQFSELLDKQLSVLNDDYATERISALKKVQVTRVPVEKFYAWMKLKGKEGSQHKFPRVMKADDYEEFLVFSRVR